MSVQKSSLSRNISTVLGVILIVFFIIIIFAIYSVLMNAFQKNNITQFNEKIHVALQDLQRFDEELTETGMYDDMKDSYVITAKKRLAAVYYGTNDTEVMHDYLIVFDQKSILVSPYLKKDQTESSEGLMKKIGDQINGVARYSYHNDQYVLVYQYFDKWKWYIGYQIKTEIMNQEALGVIFTLVLVLLINGIAIIFGINYFISRKLKPLQSTIGFADQVTRGILSVNWDEKVMARTDEIGQLNRSFSTLMNYIRKKENIASSIAGGDLTVNPELASEQDEFGRSFKKMVHALNDLLVQINQTVDQVSGGSAQVAQASQALSQGASEQASSLEEISASLTEISGQSRQNAENAQTVNGIAKESAISAEKGNEMMGGMVKSMEDINHAAIGIKKIVKTIDDIAFQINLLALNANVEAARAGKYGKGFAVVAEEVRNLAVRSAKSVQETTVMVEDALHTIDNGNKLVRNTAEVFSSIVSGARKVADLADEVAAASKEQTAGLNQISSGLGQIDQVTQANTASAEETASASEELSAQAVYLKNLISLFKLNNRFSETEVVRETRKKPAPVSQLTLAPEPVSGNKQDTRPDPRQVIKLSDDDFGKF